MFASSWTLAVSHPGFTFGLEPGTDLTKLEEAGFIFLDLLFFLFHPMILKLRSSALSDQQESIKESRDLRLSEQYEKNLAKITKLDQVYYGYKRLELNLGTIIQITLSLILLFYSMSNTTTSNSLKAIFSEEVAVPDKLFKNTSSKWLTQGQEQTLASLNTYWADFKKILDDINPIYAIMMNFAVSILSFTRYVLL